MRFKRPSASISILLLILSIYLIAAFNSKDIFILSLLRAYQLIHLLLPSLILMILIMTAMNYHINPKALSKSMEHKNKSKSSWLIAIASGVISTGPIYLWYPLLNELQKHGIKDSLLAAFLYTRAIKLPLLPLMVFYFGLQFTFILNILILALAPLQGMATQKSMELIE